MVSKTTHVFKNVDNLDLKVDAYLPTASEKPWSTAVLYLHGGGLVAFDREFLPTHVVQSCMIRGWPLFSADYRLMPQASGRDMLEDVVAAYDFVRTELLTKPGFEENIKIVLMGASAGGYLSFIAKPHLQPPPVTVFSYYAPPTCHDPFYSSNKIIGPSPFSKSQFERYFEGPVTVGPTPLGLPIFDAASLLPNHSRDPKWIQAPPGDIDDRSSLYYWLVQENKLPEMWADVDPGWDSSALKDFGKTIIVHGDEDEVVPYYMAEKFVSINSPEDVQLFTALGKNHAWDVPLFLGDPELNVVEEAWRALDKVVAEAKD
ncbi:Endomembrane 70 protein [Rutstroemia sp. NJR-2017a BBW]|nr:Endomembrane 70 protein [Rutstroemia sp. NJR-2017a BBW]